VPFFVLDFQYRHTDNPFDHFLKIRSDSKGAVVKLADLLRQCVLNDVSVASVARQTGLPQATLQEFVHGKPDGTFADLRLSSAQRLIEFYGIDQSLLRPEDYRRKRYLMNLEVELESCGCADTPAEFNNRLIHKLLAAFPGRSIDGILCEPDDAIEYCDLIREEIATRSLGDHIILKALTNIRKRKDCPTDLKSAGTRRSLKLRLRDIGSQMAPDVFQTLTVDCMADMYKSRTLDELLCHPTESRELCRFVRRKGKDPAFSDVLILKTLLNNRKNPEPA